MTLLLDILLAIGVCGMVLSLFGLIPKPYNHLVYINYGYIAAMNAVHTDRMLILLLGLTLVLYSTFKLVQFTDLVRRTVFRVLGR